MPDSTRRTFLAACAAAAGSVAGCTGGDPGEPTDRSTTTPGTDTTRSETITGVDHLSFDHADRLYRFDESFPQRDVATYYLALLRTGAHAAAFPTDRFGDSSATAFVADTDYAASTVVVLHDRRSSSTPDLSFRDVSRDGGTLALDAEYPGRGGTADITTDTLLVRVPTGGRPFHTAAATIRPQFGDAVRFATANAYDVLPAFDPAGGLVLRNRDCAGAQLSVTVTYGGDLFLRDGFDLSPSSIRRLGTVFTHPGEWTVTVRADETTERSWSLSDAPPGDVLVDVAGDGGVSLAHRPDGVADTSLDACEATDYPYESSDPSENLDAPADLWVLDHTGGEHEVTVTIRDGDAEVFRDEFHTRAGYDKIQRAGLLAEKTTYAVEVRTAADGAVTESVELREGAEKLVVRLGQSGPTVSVE